MSKRKRPTVHGILAVNKPAGSTSRAVLNRISRLYGERRCGHAGTLDPDATGVLVIAFGEATKVVRWLVEGDKSYRAEVLFGSATDSDDAAGEVIATAPLPVDFGADLLKTAIHREPGDLDQVPPAISALRRDGVRDHVRVRRGEVVERPPRRVRLDGVELVDCQGDRATFDVHCGPGFYVRAWARDLGEALGSAAHLVALQRRQASTIALHETLSMEQLEQMSGEQLQAALLPVGLVLTRRLPSLTVDPAVELQLRQGKRPLVPWPSQEPDAEALLVCGGEDERLICVAKATV